MLYTPFNEKPTGLLLCGGGAKGAFQVGAMDLLRRRGMLDNITAIAGCSVGALNMVLYAIANMTNNPSLPLKIWNTLRREDLLSTENSGSAIFSRDGLIRMIDQLPLEILQKSPFQMYVSTYNISTATPEYHLLNPLTKEQMVTILLASSALPAAYPAVEYHGSQYIDGGVSIDGYLCIQPLYAEGHRNLAILSHDSELSLYGVQDSRFVRVGKTDFTETYPDCKFLLIKPSSSLGGFLRGTLNFDAERISERIQQGARDADAILRGEAGFHDPAALNILLAKRMEMLFPNAQALAQFIKQNEDRFNKNIAMPTMGGKVWYNDIFAVDGWRLQQHRTTGLHSHYRIIDEKGVRRAWIMNPDAFLEMIEEYAAKQPKLTMNAGKAPTMA